MTDDTVLPPEVRRLINETLESMDHVELLFRIVRKGEATAEWLAQDAHVDRNQVAQVLKDLERAKLLIAADGVYRVTTSARERAAVELFADTYNARPVTLIRAVYARPSSVRSFANAFRLRGGTE